MIALIAFTLYFITHITSQSINPISRHYSLVKDSNGSVLCPSVTPFYLSFLSMGQSSSFQRIRCADLCTSYNNCTYYMLFNNYTQCALFDYVTYNFTSVKLSSYQVIYVAYIIIIKK